MRRSCSFLWIWFLALSTAVLAGLPLHGSPAKGRATSFTAPASLLHKEADWYYQDAKRREELGDMAGAAQDYALALKLVPQSHACRSALDRIHKASVVQTEEESLRPP